MVQPLIKSEINATYNLELYHFRHHVLKMTTSVLPAKWSEVSYMTKTPFIRNHSSSFEDDDDDDEEDILDEVLAPVKDEHPPRHDPEQIKIEINKKVPSSTNNHPNVPNVVNKMNQHIYADHHNQNHHAPKGTVLHI